VREGKRGWGEIVMGVAVEGMRWVLHGWWADRDDGTVGEAGKGIRDIVLGYTLGATYNYKREVHPEQP